MARSLLLSVSVDTAAATLVDVSLEVAAEEDEFFMWWDALVEWLVQRFHLTSADLYVLARGRYVGVLGLPLPGGWKLVKKDRAYRALEARRPRGTFEEQKARLWRQEGNPRDVSTTTLSRWLDDRARGELDLVLIDALSPESFAAQHLPGAVNVPLAELDAARAESVIGPRRDRLVVVYCTGYG